MKIQSIYRNKNERQPDAKGDVIPKRTSKDAIYNPLILEKEYVRSLNATKLERLFAKPFIAALSYHTEGINHLCKNIHSNVFASASYDRQIILWDLKEREILKKLDFKFEIQSIALDSYSNVYVAQEKSVFARDCEFKTNSIVNSIDVTNSSDIVEMAVATAQDIQIFDVNRFTPKIVYKNDSTTKVCFNESFKHLMGAISSLNINLFDNRSCKPFATVDTEFASCMKFNPQKGYMFAVGQENGDSTLYDLRKLESPVNVYRGHVNAVVSVAFNPNGTEIATGSFDRTIRIFEVEARKSRDVYYNDRMQIVHGVEYSNDGQYIISGSDDGSLRIWRANASKKVGPISKQEKDKNVYNEALKEKFKNVGEISRISKHRFLPKELKQQMHRKHEKFEAQVRRKNKREEKRRIEEQEDE